MNQPPHPPTPADAAVHPGPGVGRDVDAELGSDARQWLSAAADGDASATDQVSQLWRASADARSTWHRYHLIGDVMRSAELARAPAHDAAFLTALRSRMATEPVLLAPAQLPTAAGVPAAFLASPLRRLRPGWEKVTAVAAGLVVVAGVLVVTRLSGPGETTGAVVAAVQQPDGVLRVGIGTLSPSARPATGTLIRDARLDEFLRAHQSARGGFAVALPSNALRRVDVDAPEGLPR